MSDKCVLCPEIAEFEYNDKNLCSRCVSREAAKIEAPDEPPKKRPYRNKGKSIDEVNARENYSGEASPYWNAITQQHWQMDNNQLMETPEANPDVLPETASLYAHIPGDDEELRADVLREVVEGLTSLQREALTLCEQPDYTEESAATKLGITRRAFRTMIDRIKSMINRKISQREENSRWQK